jgi:RNA polymerase sigma factor (sigma-70 family)
MDDRQLLPRYVADRSSEDFAELVRRNAPLVYGSAHRQMRDEHLAEDVTQAVFLLLSQKASQVKGPLAGWLLTATRFTARNMVKLSARRQFHERRASRARREPAETETQTTWESYAPMLDAAMNRLSRAERDCIAMRYLRGLSLTEIAATLRITESAAQKRVNRSIARLRRNMLVSASVPSLAAFADQLSASGAVRPSSHLLTRLGARAVAGEVVRTIAAKTAIAMRWAQMKAMATLISTVAILGGGAGLIVFAIERVAPSRTAQLPPATQPSAVANTQPIISSGITPITLDVKDMDARDALKEIGRQAGVKTALWPDTLWSGNYGQLSYRVSLHLDHAPFWSAIAALCGQTLSIPRPVQFGPTSPITICDAGGQESNDQLGGRMYMSGPFTIVADSIVHSRRMDLANGATNRQDSLRLSIFVDPKTHLLQYGAPWLQVADDDRGNSMIASHRPENETLMQTFSCDWMLQQDVALKFPTPDGKQLAVLKGAFPAVTEVSAITLTIDDLTHSINKSLTGAGRTITLSACEMHGQNGSLTFNITRSAGAPAPEEPALNEALQNISILDANGTPLQILNSVRDSETLRCNFSQSSPIQLPIRLVWRITTKSKSSIIPFEFRDLPLPAD